MRRFKVWPGAEQRTQNLDPGESHGRSRAIVFCLRVNAALNSPNAVRGFSIIVPTCDRVQALAACLERLAPGAQTLPASDYEVIVSDDAVGRETQTMVRERFRWVRWTQGPRRGPAANRNQGAKSGGYDWLVFLDDDCLPGAGWLAAYDAAAREQPSIAVLEGRTLACGERRSVDMEAPVNTEGGCLWSCNFAIRSSLFAAMGGFDVCFPGPTMEDVEFRTRLKKQQIASAFVPAALVYHPWRRRRGGRFPLTYARSVDRLLVLHPEEEALFSPKMIVRIFLATLRREVRDAIRISKGRGLARAIWLDLYIFALLAVGTLRRKGKA